MTLLRIADLSDVWVFAQLYPYQLPWLREGQAAEIRVPGLPGRVLAGRVNYIQPVVSAEARTVEVRIQVSQPGDGILLKPNMYGNVEIRSSVQQEAVTIREQAVIRSGERSVAIIALGNGYFEPRVVELGATGDGYVEILAGIEPGEEVVTSSQFLLDSESNLRSALGAMQAMPGMQHGQEGGAAESPPAERQGPTGAYGEGARPPEEARPGPGQQPEPRPSPAPAAPESPRPPAPPEKPMPSMPGM